MTTLTELRQRISQAQAKKARAEVLLEQAEADIASSRNQLQSEYGVSTPDEARAMIEQLTRDRDEAIAAAEAQLLEAEQ